MMYVRMPFQQKFLGLDMEFFTGNEVHNEALNEIIVHFKKKISRLHTKIILKNVKAKNSLQTPH